MSPDKLVNTFLEENNHASTLPCRLTGKGVDEKGVIPNDKACAVSGCTDRYWCEVTAVCQLIEDRSVRMNTS